MRFEQLVSYYKTKIGLVKTNILNAVEKQCYNGVVLEMDGRLYTSVLAKLCKDVIGNHVKALIMPSGIFSKHDDVCDAIDLASSFGIQFRIQDITHIGNAITLGCPKPNFDNMARLNEFIKLACLYHEGDSRNYAVIGLNTGHVDSIRYSYNCLPLENILPQDIEGMASLLDVPEHIIRK